MLAELLKHPKALGISLAFHAVLIVLIVVNLDFSDQPDQIKVGEVTQAVKAEVIDSKQLEEKKQQEELEAKRKKDAERKLQDAKKTEEKKKKEAERKRKEDEKRKAELKRKKEAEAKTLGWSCFVPPYKMRLSAYVVTDTCRIVRVAKNDLLRLFNDDPLMGYRFMSYMITVVGYRFHQFQAYVAKNLGEDLISGW